MNVRLGPLCLSLFSAMTVAAADTPAAVRQINVRLESATCTNRPTTIFLIINDREERAATFTDGVWSWKSDGEPPVPIGVPKKAQLGVRYEGGRTHCQHPDDFIANKQNVGVANFTFKECSSGASDITMKVSFDKRIKPPLSVTYVRELDAASKVKYAAPCREELSFQSNKEHPFLGFWYDVETLSIYLYKPRKEAEGRDLPINAILKNSKPRTLKKSTEIGPDKVTFQWEKQRAGGHKSQPRISPTEIDIDVQLLDDIQFRSLTLTVH